MANLCDYPANVEDNILLMNTLLNTALAMIAFAANSVLCRLALGAGLIDAAAFTSIRLISGVLVLSLLLLLQNRNKPVQSRGSWLGGAMLFLYAICFSYAYLSLETGTGALILFGSVQITMILVSMVFGYKPNRREWTGVVLAFGGFVFLVLPGISAPSLQGFILMGIAGISWGVYSLIGRKSKNPLMDTAYNFLRTLPLVILLLLANFSAISGNLEGVVLAMLSGGLASGIGYAIWYRALSGLGSTQAAVVQLSVPIIAAAGGVIFIDESLTWRLTIATILVMGGILLVITAPIRQTV